MDIASLRVATVVQHILEVKFAWPY